MIRCIRSKSTRRFNIVPVRGARARNLASQLGQASRLRPRLRLAVALLIPALLIPALLAGGCADEHGVHHQIPPEVAAAAQLKVFTKHLGAAEYGPANWVKSPNYTTAYRKKGQITTIVIHTVQGTYNSCISWFQNPKAQVSAHYVVSKTGAITQMVKEKDIGWHVGSANGYTIGIEHEGYVSDPKWATPAMLAASAKLTCYLIKKYGLSATKTNIKGHVDLPNQTHTDPGKYWPWAAYLAQVSACAKGGTVDPCTQSCDDGKACTKDVCVKGKCSHSWDNGKVCWDGDACTVGEKCSNGSCIGGKITKNCNDNNPCTNDGCAASTCTHVANNHACNDGNPCTKGDVCKSKSCIGSGGAGGCNDGNPCTKDVCASGGCSHAATSGACSDGDACTVGDACANGVCKAGAPKSCSDGNPCTTGDACNTGTGACSPGVWKVCGKGDTCSAGTCDPKLGGCKPQNDGVTCDDNNPCTSKTVCSSGVCGGGATLGCDDGNPCTNDSCSLAGCGHLATAMFCDDGDPCTLADACVAGICTGQQISCDDGDVCTTGQLCVGGSCSAGHAICDDGNDCTSDKCAGGVCSHAAIVVDCDDGDDCTVKEYCDTGVCQGGAIKSCDDGEPCTADRCTPDKGCAHHNLCGGDRPDAMGDGATASALDGSLGGGGVGERGLASPASGCRAGRSGPARQVLGFLLLMLSALASGRTGLLRWRRRA